MIGHRPNRRIQNWQAFHPPDPSKLPLDQLKKVSSMPGISPQSEALETRERTAYYSDLTLKEEISPKVAEQLKFKANDPHPETLRGKAELMYYHYRLITGTDMLDKWERLVFSTSARTQVVY